VADREAGVGGLEELEVPELGLVEEERVEVEFGVVVVGNVELDEADVVGVIDERV